MMEPFYNPTNTGYVSLDECQKIEYDLDNSYHSKPNRLQCKRIRKHPECGFNYKKEIRDVCWDDRLLLNLQQLSDAHTSKNEKRERKHPVYLMLL